MNIISKWKEDYKAWRRQEVRVAPKEARGRVFEDAPTHPRAKVAKVVNLRVRVIRANGDIEEIKRG